MIARQLRPEDVVPFDTGMTGLTIDHQWGWIVEVDGVIVGLLLLAPVHGAVMLVRLAAGPNAPVSWIKRVLTQASSDVLKRGYKVAYVYLNLERELDQRLAKLMMGHGKEGHRGIHISSHALCATAVEDWC